MKYKKTGKDAELTQVCYLLPILSIKDIYLLLFFVQIPFFLMHVTVNVCLVHKTVDFISIIYNFEKSRYSHDHIVVFNNLLHTPHFLQESLRELTYISRDQVSLLPAF